jgi:hypothetical protein
VRQDLVEKYDKPSSRGITPGRLYPNKVKRAAEPPPLRAAAAARPPSAATAVMIDGTRRTTSCVTDPVASSGHDRAAGRADAMV